MGSRNKIPVVLYTHKVSQETLVNNYHIIMGNKAAKLGRPVDSTNFLTSDHKFVALCPDSLGAQGVSNAVAVKYNLRILGLQGRVVDADGNVIEEGDPLITTMRNVVKNVYPKTAEIKWYPGEEFLASVPMGTKNTIITSNVKILWCNMFKEMLLQNWFPLVTFDLQRYLEMDSILFEKTAKVLRKPDHVACLSFDSNHSFELISEKSIHDELLESLKKLLDDNWPKYSVVKEKDPTVNGYDGRITSIDFKKQIWMIEQGKHEGNDLIKSRVLLADIVSKLGRSSGWEFLCNANLKGIQDDLFYVKYENSEDDAKQNPGRRMSTIRNSTFDATALLQKSAVLSVTDINGLRIANVPTDIWPLINDIIEVGDWPLDHMSEKSNGYEWVFSGNPWWARGNQAVTSRQFLMYVFEKLYLNGLKVTAALNVSLRVNEKGFFCLAPTAPPAKLRSLCLSYSDTGDIYITGSFNDVELKSYQDTILKHWPEGIAKQYEISDKAKVSLFPGYRCYYLMLYNAPWSCQKFNNKGAHAMNICAQLLCNLREHNWELLMCTDATARVIGNPEGKDFKVDGDAWFLINTTN